MSDKDTARLRDSELPKEGELVDGRYLIKKVIGRGGMSCIVCAQQLTMQRDVAIKLLHPHVASEELTIARFKREVHLAKSLAHPNIIQYYDYGTLPNGSLYLVMELLEGCDLHAMIRREGNFSLHRAIDVTMQVLDGLTEAHAKSVIHRDLKPRNLFMLDLNRRGDYVKILDFGIAKSTQAEESELTKTGVVCGTPSYLAPELLITQNASPASDLYAVGLIFLEMLTGRRAFKADTMARTFFMQLRHPVPIPGRFRGTPLEDFLLFALAKHPDDRFQSAQDMMDELDSLRVQMPHDIRLSPDDVDSLVDSQASQAPGMSALDNMGLEILRDPAWAITPTPLPFNPDPEDDVPTTLAELGSGPRLTVPSRAALRNSSGHHPTREYGSLSQSDLDGADPRTRPARRSPGRPTDGHAADAFEANNAQEQAAQNGFAGVPVDGMVGFGAAPPPSYIRTAEVRRDASSGDDKVEASSSKMRTFTVIGLVGALLIALGLTVTVNMSDADESAAALPYDVPQKALGRTENSRETAEEDPAVAANARQDPDFAFVNKLADPAPPKKPAEDRLTKGEKDEKQKRALDDPGHAQKPANSRAEKPASKSETDRRSATRSKPPETRAAKKTPKATPTPEAPRKKRADPPKRRSKPAATSVEEFMQNNTILGDDSSNDLF